MSAPIELARNIFLNEDAELRCGWRIAVFVVCLLLASLVISGLLALINRVIPSLPLTVEPSDPQSLPNSELVYLITSRTTALITVVAATAVCAPLLEHRSVGSVGFKLHRGWWRDFLIGAAVGGAAIALAVGIAKISGAVSFESAAFPRAPLAERSMLLAAATAVLFFLVAAAFEELLFRGFVFQALLHNAGPVVALVLTSVPFGIAHLANPSSTAFSTINTVLAGLWLGAAYLATRSLWMATGLHFSWNFVMAFFFGLPVSGLVTLDRLALVLGRSGSPEWLSGGNYGPEGGLAATIALLLATVLIWKTRIFRPADEMREALTRGRRGQNEIAATPVNSDQAIRPSER
ncbi:MAG TPA: CPBP family intramembrane glutamic endopeptidase [Blastocatellia bacterium]|nr:CPBP family intramembrane glutamic endopeptidase [Blastocatellia bacterium]